MKILGLQPTTRATALGVLAIDDTACPKPYAKNTEGAKFPYCASLKREENCNVAVASCFVSETKHFPIEFKSYLPIETTGAKDFKSKLDLAKELVESALTQDIGVSAVCVDNWYASSDFIEFVVSKNLDLISEVKSNRSILFTDPKTRQWRQIQRHWILSFLAWSLAYWIKQNACLSKIIHEPPVNIAQCKKAVGLLLIFDSTRLLSKNPALAATLAGIKSHRFADG